MCSEYNIMASVNFHVMYVMKLFLFLVLFNLPVYSSIKSSQDSLMLLLENCGNDDELKLELLNQLTDIDFLLDESKFTLSCWNEAAKQNNILVMDDIAVPLILSYNATNQIDSAQVWIKRCKDNFKGDWLSSNLEYIKLMSDVRAYKDYDKLAKQLLAELPAVNQKKEPFVMMRILYSLAAISNAQKELRPSAELKQAKEYLLEAYEIVNEIPFRLGVRFKRQILLALSSYDIEYAKEYTSFITRFYHEPDIENRPFYSRKAIALAYDMLILNGEKLSKVDLDMYYTYLNELMKRYPKSMPIEAPYFNLRIKYNYHKASGNIDSALVYCDKLICEEYKYADKKPYLYEYKYKMLGELNRWEEGYKAASRLLEIRDSLSNVNLTNKIVELETVYEVGLLKEQSKNKSKLIILFLITMISLFAIVFILVIYERRLRIKNKILLDQLNQQVRSTQNTVAISTQTGSDECFNRSEDTVVSDLKKEELISIFNKLEALMTDKKLYRDSGLHRDTLTAYLGINKNKLTESIFLVANKSLTDYITDIRLNDSLLMMKEDPNLTLTEIAEACGFNAYSTFYRSFYKKYGVKPNEYRKYIEITKE